MNPFRTLSAFFCLVACAGKNNHVASRLVIRGVLGVIIASSVSLLSAFVHAKEAPTTQFLYADNEVGETTIWVIDAIRPAAREAVYRFSHADSWTGNYALSPDGSRIAFTV